MLTALEPRTNRSHAQTERRVDLRRVAGQSSGVERLVGPNDRDRAVVLELLDQTGDQVRVRAVSRHGPTHVYEAQVRQDDRRSKFPVFDRRSPSGTREDRASLAAAAARLLVVFYAPASTPGACRFSRRSSGLFIASRGDIFKLSKILGRSSVASTQQVSAHLHPNAFAEDYSRVASRCPRKRAPW